MPEVDYQILPIAVASFIPMVVGALWYSKLMFMNLWMKYSGVTEKEMSETNPVLAFGGSFLFAIVLSVVLYTFLSYSEVETNMEALQVALMVWLGFSVAFGYSNQVFSKHSWGEFVLYQGYQLVNIIIMSLVLINL